MYAWEPWSQQWSLVLVYNFEIFRYDMEDFDCFDHFIVVFLFDVYYYIQKYQPIDSR